MEPQDPAPDHLANAPTRSGGSAPVGGASPGTESAGASPASLVADALPQAVVKARTRRTRFSLIWLLPLVAVLVALAMAVHNWLSTGPVIHIHFKSAEGLVAGKSQVRYKEVMIGTVQKIALEDNGDGVVVRVQLDGSAAKVANTASRFWIVRPQLGLGGISGLNTLLSGAYIGVDAGDYTNAKQTDFTGLEQPPAVTRASKGKRYYLVTHSLGSLAIGSPVYFRRIPVGRVTSYALENSGHKIGVEIFVDEPYDAFVTESTRFWNASGVDISVGSDGFKVNTESLAAMVAGGVAFGEPPIVRLGVKGDVKTGSAMPPAPEGSRFDLFDTHKAALTSRQEKPVPVRLRYDQSVRGLAAGAPIELRGKAIGHVVDTSLDFDPVKHNFFIWVDALVYPRQLGDAFVHLQSQNGTAQSNPAQQDRDFIRYLVEHGYRAQLKTGNLLTGQLYVSFEPMPKAGPFQTDWEAVPLQLPTAPGSFDQLQTQLASIATRLEKVKFDEIGADLQRSLHSAHKALDTANQSLHSLTPQARTMIVDAQKALKSAETTLQSAQQAVGPGGLPDQTGEAMQEVKKAARTLRSLGDYLQANPDALVRGRSNKTPEILPVPAASSPPP